MHFSQELEPLAISVCSVHSEFLKYKVAIVCSKHTQNYKVLMVLIHYDYNPTQDVKLCEKALSNSRKYEGN